MFRGRLARYLGLIVTVIGGGWFIWRTLPDARNQPLGHAYEWQFNLQQPASVVQEQVYRFHNLLFILAVVISGFVLSLLWYTAVRFSARNHPTPTRTAHNTLIEVIWTVVPVLILLTIAIPSFRLLYLTDRAIQPEMTLVVHGYQWYWGYEYPDQQIPEYASYLVTDENLQPGQPRLLTVDHPVVLPVDTDIQVLVTAGDVLHSWAMPAFGMKRDAVPGRMHEAWVRIDKEGTYYGQCSELCGMGHGYMPIEVHAVSRQAFNDWVTQQVAGKQLERPPVLLTLNGDDAKAAQQVAATASP